MGLDVRVLGDLGLTRDGVELDLGGRRPRALLALLVVERGRMVGMDAIVDRLWPDDPPDAAVKTIQVYVSRLRAALGDERERIVSAGGGYRFALADDELDAALFGADVAKGRGLLAAGSAETAIGRLDRALERWHGRPFGELADEPFLLPETRRLEDLHAEANELRASALVAAGRPEEAIAPMRRLVADEPARESAWTQLLLALYAAGRQAEALDAFHRVRTYLDGELGIEPGPDLQAAHLAVLQQTAPVVARPATASDSPTDGPSAGPGLIGRDRELAEVDDLFRGGARLVTIVGPGGIGKTTLCRAFLERVRPAVDGLVVLVELEAVRGPDLVPDAVAAALGAENAQEVIGDAAAVLGLDNLEQVLGAAPWVAELLRACPRLQIVATSREPLRIGGERVYQLGPLDAASGSELFLARARPVRPDLQRSAEIDAVCRRLDGLPLAIELAAARTNLLSPEALLTRLDRVLDVLAQGPRDRSDRQRTLRTTIAWSYDLLDQPLQAVFRRLSTFAGGFGIEAAETVAGAGLDDLDQLLAQSLLTVRYDRAEPRFGLLETIRAFAAEQLGDVGEEDAVRRAHAAWACTIAERPRSSGSAEPAALATLALELDNLREAMRWASTAEPETRWRIAVGLSDVWQVRGHLAEGRTWLEDGLGEATIPDEVRVEALHDASTIALRQGQLEDTKRLAGQQLELARRLAQPRRIVTALAKLAQVAVRSGDPEAARRYHAEALTVASGDTDRRALLVSLTGQANIDLAAGRADLAAAAFETCVALAQEVGRTESVATAWFNLGLARVVEGSDLDRARTALREALDRYVDLDDVEGIGYALVAAARLAITSDPRLAARALAASSVALARADAELEVAELGVRETVEAALGETLDPGELATIAAAVPDAPEAWIEIARSILEDGPAAG